MPLFCFLGLFTCLCSYHTVQLHTDSNYTGERRAPTPTLFLSLCLRLLWPEAGDGKLRPTGQIQPVTCIWKHSFIGVEPQACICLLSTAAFSLQTQERPYVPSSRTYTLFGQLPKVCKPLA